MWEVMALRLPLLLLLPRAAARVGVRGGGGTDGGQQGWELTFEDEFGGDALDPQKWSVRSCPCFRNGSWTEEAVSVRNGMLSIATALHWTADGRLNASSGHINTSSVWRSGGGFSQRYGKFEVRARVPGAPGISPAIWMMPDDAAVCWPAGGEIDIAETTCTGGQNPGGVPRFAWGSLHYSSAGECGAGPHHKAASGYWPCKYGADSCHPTTNLADAFHTYTVVWAPEKLEWLIDGDLYFSTNSTVAQIPTRPFYFILQAALVLNPEYHTRFDPARYPVSFLVDWVRAYRQTERPANEAPPPPPLTASSGPMTLSLNAEGEYSLRVGDRTWLKSAPTMLHSGGRWLRFSVTNISTGHGSDALGSYTRLAASLTATGGTPRLEVGFRVYSATEGVVVAEQTFLDDVVGVRLSAESPQDQAASAFPHWRTDQALVGSGGLRWLAGCDAAPAHSAPGARFPAGYASSFIGLGLPLALVDDAQQTLVMSPVTAFVSSTLALTNLSVDGGGQGLAAGIVGSVADIAAGLSVETIMTMPRAGGDTEAMMSWGDAMLALGGKARAQHDAVPMVSHLGYSTTAFYFYDPLAGESCECDLALDLIPEVQTCTEKSLTRKRCPSQMRTRC